MKLVLASQGFTTDEIAKEVEKIVGKSLKEINIAIINEAYVGKIIPCIVEGYTDDGVVLMRSEHDAPEIDGMVYASSDKPVVPGDIENVLIERADEYDLFGVLQ